MCDPNLLYSTKEVLKFLLNSNNRAAHNTIYTLDDEFFNFVGCRIPYYDLGYRYLEIFLQSIPDVLSIELFSKQVQPSNCRNQTHSNNVPVPAYYRTTVPSNGFQGLPRSPGMSNWSNCGTQWKQQRKNFNCFTSGNVKREFRPLSIRQPSNNAQHMWSSEVTNASPRVQDKTANQVQKSITILEGQAKSDFKLLSRTKNGDVLAEKGLSDRNTPDNDAPMLNSPNTSESGAPPYAETDMINVAGAIANSNDNVDSCHQKYLDSESDDYELMNLSVESVNARINIPDEDEVPHKLNSNKAILYNNGAIPFIANDDFILMIGSKFSDKRYGDNIETVNIETKMKVGGFYDLYISEVNSPFKFWFQLIEDNNCELYDLEKHLNAFYNTSSMDSGDHIDEIYMAKGYPCAVLYYQQWHRAVFLGKPEDKKVKLFFADYGTVAKVSTSDIRYLLHTFCRLPRQCFRGTLDFIKPIHQRWNNEATAYFCDLIKDVKLVAGVSEINTKHNSARIYVKDQSKNITVNCKLVEDHYAFPENPRDRCQNNIADMLPTFESLEKGEYPSLAEMHEYLVQGFDVDKMFETNIIDGVDCYISQHMSDEETMKTIQKFFKEKEMAKEIASKRDATIFMTLFGHMLNNPYLNGVPFQADEMKNVSSRNPFLDDYE